MSRSKCVDLITETVRACAAKCGAAPLRHHSKAMKAELYRIEEAAAQAALDGNMMATKTHLERWLSAHKWAMDREGISL